MQTVTISLEIFGEEVDLTIHDIRIGMLSDEGYRRVQIQTEQGAIECHYYAVPNARKAVVMVGSILGGFDSPGENVYPRLASHLLDWQINCLQIRFRDPMDMSEGILDVLAGLSFLQSEHIESVGVVGHSFGGAIALQAAVLAPIVSTIVTLAAQSFGAESITQLEGNQSVLLLHGKKDEVLPALSSATLYQLAHEPKDIFFFKDATHSFDEVGRKLYEKIYNWLITHV